MVESPAIITVLKNSRGNSIVFQAFAKFSTLQIERPVLLERSPAPDPLDRPGARGWPGR